MLILHWETRSAKVPEPCAATQETPPACTASLAGAFSEMDPLFLKTFPPQAILPLQLLGLKSLEGKQELPADASLAEAPRRSRAAVWVAFGEKGRGARWKGDTEAEAAYLHDYLVG